MSWFSDIAGKAEGLLNHLDQSAASALQKTPSPSSATATAQKAAYRYHGASDLESGAIEKTIGHHATPTTTFELPRRSTSHVAFEASPKREHRNAPTLPTNLPSFSSSGYASSVSSLLGLKTHVKDEEEKLIDYLNEPGATSAERSGNHEDDSSITDQPAQTVPLSRRSSSSSLRSLPTHLARTAEKRLDHISVPIGEGLEKEEETTSVPMASYSQISTTFTPLPLERDLKEHMAREADLRKALQAKDSQLAVLRVRLQEADQQLEAKTRALQRLETEQQRLLKDSVDSSAYRNQALETIQQQLRDAQAALDRERFESKQSESNYLARIQKLESEQSEIVQQLTAVQKSLTEEKLRCKQTAEQLKLAKYNLEANKQEFDEYKQKAQRILQTKEKLLETLKESNIGPASDQAGLMVELEELRTERDLLKEDLQQTQLQLYNLKADFQELESQLAGEQRQALEQQYQLQEQCQQYQHSAAQYREQFEQLKQEYQYMQDEGRRHQFALQTKLQEKDAEITRLMNQVTSRTSAIGSDSAEFETRVRQLTESLIQKQTVIESLQTDKKSLSLQLERMEHLYQEAEGAAIRASSTTVHAGSADDGLHSRVPAFLRETPHDTGVTRGVKRAYTTVDSLSVKVGLFLRRYPAARVCVFCYMTLRDAPQLAGGGGGRSPGFRASARVLGARLGQVSLWPLVQVLLHIWVMVVLLTYTPESHSSDYHEPRSSK